MNEIDQEQKSKDEKNIQEQLNNLNVMKENLLQQEKGFKEQIYEFKNRDKIIDKTNKLYEKFENDDKIWKNLFTNIKLDDFQELLQFKKDIIDANKNKHPEISSIYEELYRLRNDNKKLRKEQKN